MHSWSVGGKRGWSESLSNSFLGGLSLLTRKIGLPEVSLVVEGGASKKGAQKTAFIIRFWSNLLGINISVSVPKMLVPLTSQRTHRCSKGKRAHVEVISRGVKFWLMCRRYWFTNSNSSRGNLLNVTAGRLINKIRPAKPWWQENDLDFAKRILWFLVHVNYNINLHTEFHTIQILCTYAKELLET